MNKTSISDLPFNENINDFGTERYVNGLIKFIENSSAPITIALQGEWGSGKTSLMTRLERALCSATNAQFIGIEINTWEYSMMSSPEATVYKILAQLVRELTKNDPDSKKIFNKFLRGAGKFLYRGAREGLKTIRGIGDFLGVLLEAMNVPTQLPDGSESDGTASLSELRKALSEAVQKSITDTNKRGVIIFVDDLDRLNPPVAVEILELLKNIFTLDNCIFVLAIDYDVVVKGLKPKFGELTEKNEREFRSFFDKIIQVPFSLPVNNYRPMDFMLKSLMDIGYIRPDDLSNPEVHTLFSTVVEASVGKNPRSIKRLINTLSLIGCIEQSGCETYGQDSDRMKEDKLLNLIIVSIQISYPKIYRMLSLNPDFTGWNDETARKWGIRLDNGHTDEESDIQWMDVLKAACMQDSYLEQHLADITQLLNLIIDVYRGMDNTEQQLGKKMKEIMDKSSVTGINADFKAETIDKRGLIQKLNKNVADRIREKRPDVKIWKLKKITADGCNGGIKFRVDENTYPDIAFSLVNSENRISLRLWLDLNVKRPERLIDKSFDELLKEPQIADNIRRLDEVLAPLLQNSGFFKGRIYDSNASYFPSYTEELRHIHNNGAMPADITNNPHFWIDLDKPSRFEDDDIVDTIARVLIANYDFRKAMIDLEAV